jgi:NifU-like protein involved in Fe-S cluster formation
MRSLAAFLLPALVAATPIAQNSGDGWAASVSPDDITITSATYSGNGCPQNTVSTSISTDATVRNG